MVSNLCVYLLRRTMKNIQAACLLTAFFKNREEPKILVLFSRSRSHFMLSPSCHQPRRPGDSRRNIVPISGTGQKYSISFETMFRFWAWAAFWEKRMSVKLSIWRFKTIIRIVSSHNPHVLLRIHFRNLLFGKMWHIDFTSLQSSPKICFLLMERSWNCHLRWRSELYPYICLGQ